MVEDLIFSGVGNDARDSDPLALYPLWHIGVGLDKYYPGNVYGVYVDIWADTGQVKDVYEVFSTLQAPANAMASIADSSISEKSVATHSNSVSVLPMELAIFAGTIIGAFPVWLLRKRTALSSLGLLKTRRVSKATLCILISVVMLLSLTAAVPTANASVANIWGETAAGSPYLFHTAAEIAAQTQLSGNISVWFGNSGYSSNNFQANSQTTKYNVLTYTGGQYSTSVETVYFDHGVGTPGGNGFSYPYDREWHYQLCTDLTTSNSTSENVFDYQLYSVTSTANQYFSYISCCHSASLYNGEWFSQNYPDRFPAGCTGTYGANQGGSGYIIGMPYAWTHGASLSTDGFVSPDTGPYCYIGFVEGSASLCQDVDNRPSGTVTYGPFVWYFFDGLLNLHLTVNQALDHASNLAFPPEWFAATELFQGFEAEWPAGVGGGWGKMVAYGNGDIYLYLGDPDYVSLPALSGVPSPGLEDTAYEFSASATDPYGYSLTYTIDWGDGSDPAVTSYPYGLWHTWDSPGNYIITVTAQSSRGISNTNHYGIRINGPYPGYYWLTVRAVDGSTGYPLYPDIGVDWNYVGTGYASVQVSEGWHDVEMNDPTWNGYGMYWSYLSYFTDGYGNGEDRPIYSDLEIVGVYY